jgi:hypothetical protein
MPPIVHVSIQNEVMVELVMALHRITRGPGGLFSEKLAFML